MKKKSITPTKYLLSTAKNSLKHTEYYNNPDTTLQIQPNHQIQLQQIKYNTSNNMHKYPSKTAQQIQSFIKNKNNLPDIKLKNIKYIENRNNPSSSLRKQSSTLLTTPNTKNKQQKNPKRMLAIINDLLDQSQNKKCILVPKSTINTISNTTLANLNLKKQSKLKGALLLQPIRENPIENTLGLVKKSNYSKQYNKNNDIQKGISGYQLKQKIGQGAFAEVRLAYDKIEKKSVVIKIYQKYRLFDPQRRKNINNQIKILQHISHPNIIKLYKVIETNKSFNLIMQHLAYSKSLKHFLNQFPKLSQNQIRVIIKQLASALDYLHNKKISHRDIKLQNILIVLNKKYKTQEFQRQISQIKLIDFGFSVQYHNNNGTCFCQDCNYHNNQKKQQKHFLQQNQGQKNNFKKLQQSEQSIKQQSIQKFNQAMLIGTPNYMSPELIDKKKKYDPFKSDIWALGILFYYMLCGYFPFRGDSKSLYRKILKCELLFPQKINPGCEYLIRKMLREDVDERISAQDILQDTWIKPINFKQKINLLMNKQRKIGQA